MIFKNCIDRGVFSNTWKISHIIPIHKKNDKSSLTNYRPVSLLPTCGKIFERIIFNYLFECLKKFQLSARQSVFWANESSVDQLLSFVYNIHTASDAYPTLKSCLVDRCQRIVLNRQTTEWLPVKAGIAQGYVLGLLFLLIYIIDLSTYIVSILC